MSDINIVTQPQTVSVVSSTQIINVDPITSSVSIINAGPPGPAGSSAGYDHTQSSDSALWVINHNLGYKPSVQIFSVGGLEVIGEIHHISVNQVNVSFNDSISGSARLV
jgi:hypothetical protein